MNTLLIALADIPKNSSNTGVFCMGAIILIFIVLTLFIALAIKKGELAAAEESDEDFLADYEYDVEKLKIKAKTEHMRSVFTRVNNKLSALENSELEGNISDEAMENLKKARKKYDAASSQYYGVESPDLASVYLMLMVANILSDEVRSEIGSSATPEEYTDED